MAEIAVLFVLRQSLPFVVKGTLLLTRFRRNFTEIKNELEYFQNLLKNADTEAADNDRVKVWVKQLREECFRVEDVIDKYNMYVAQRVNVNNSRFISIPQDIFLKIPTLKSCKVASKINGIKVSLASIKNRTPPSVVNFQAGNTTEGGSFRNQDTDAYFNKEVVGFQSSRDELISWLVDKTDELKLVAVVGMAGLGKTTLAKHVYDNESVEWHFDCRFYISASQFNTAEELLIDMISKFCKASKEKVPDGLKEMDQNALTEHVKQYLKSKRYLMCFDDVRKEDFYTWIRNAMKENKEGSRIIVTTRKMHAVDNFKRDFSVHLHELNLWPHDKAFKLFCKRAFRGQQCPTELVDMSHEIVKQCGGIPLAIVTIGGRLSTKRPRIDEWRRMSQNLSMHSDGNTHFTEINTILSWSYDDLPWHLKLCMLYFGIYPEQHTINCKRLIGQWIAEGFVESDGRTLEEVAEEYLKELIQASLVQVSSAGIDGKVKSCEVHNLLRGIIVRKMKELSFCHIMEETHEQDTVDITRRFSIETFSDNVLRSNSNSGIRAIFVFDQNNFPRYFKDNLSVKFKLIKILDFAHSLLNYVPANLGSLFNLKYLNLSHTKVKVLPRSIGNLVNLETLDLRQTEVHELPMEINKLTKLRLLPVYYKIKAGNYSMLTDTKGVKMQKGIGCLKSLQKLYFLEADHGGIVLVQELKKLRELRKLGIRHVRREYGNALCATIQEMKHLESLNITVIAEEEILDLDFVSTPPPNLKVLNLKCKLTKLPTWIPKLKYLVKLMLGFCKFEHDPLNSLQNLKNLSWLILWDDAFAGHSLNFEVGGFPKLKELDLTRLNTLSSVSIGRGALPALEYFSCHGNPQLTVLPSDLQNLGNLKYLGFADMPAELVDSIKVDGPCHRIINHIPLVQVREKVESRFHEYDWRRIPTCLKYKKDMEVRILYQIFMSILRNAFLLKSISEISRFIFSVLKLTRRYTLNSFNGQFTLAFFFCFLSFMAWIFSTNSRMVI